MNHPVADVHVPGLLAQLLPLQGRPRVYWGKIMHGGKRLLKGRNSEPHLPKSISWFPPYASGAGYALSGDLVRAVAFPAVKLVPMVNEDAHMGIVLLPFDVQRVSTDTVHAHGLGDCTTPEHISIVHYVKDPGGHDCMSDMHANITRGEAVCKNRYCGPLVCNSTGPQGKKRCEVDADAVVWERVHQGRACEQNPEGITRIRPERHMVDLKCCLQICEQTCGCTAVDYYGPVSARRGAAVHTPLLTAAAAGQYVVQPLH